MDRYLAILLSPREKQPALMALAAFHCELGHIHHAVSEPSLAAIRFQWWRDALQSAQSGEGERTGNPVADAMVDILNSHDLPFELIEEMLDLHQGISLQTSVDVAGTGTLTGGGPGTETETEPAPEAPLFELCALVLGAVRGEELRQASIAAAKALAAAKSHGEDRAGLADIAASQRKKCARLLQSLPANIFPAFLPVGLTEFHLAGLADNPARNLRRIWTVWRTHRKKNLE